MTDGQDTPGRSISQNPGQPARSEEQAMDSGTVIWAFDTDGQVRSSPTVVGETVFVGSHDGSVYALDAETGDKRWEVDTNADVEASPTVVRETVFVSNHDGAVYALDASSGDTVWQFEVEDSVYSSPTVVHGTVIFGSDDGVVYGLDEATGESDWTFQTASAVRTAPTVVEDTVVCGDSNGAVYAIDATTGEQHWKGRTSGTAVRSSPTVSDGRVFIGGFDDRLYALDMADGTEEWTAGTRHSVWASPTVLGSTVFVGDRAGYVYALDVENGRLVWQANTGRDVFSSPTVADGTVFFGNDDNRLYALDAATGESEWTVDTDGRIRSSPTVVDGVLFVGSSGGTVYAVDTGTVATSEDSRVELMTLGHTERLRHATQRLKTPIEDSEEWIDTQHSTVQKHLKTAREAFGAGMHDRALAWCGQAVEVAERTHETAREDAPHRVAEIESQLDEGRTLRESIEAEREDVRTTAERLDQAEESLDDAAATLETGSYDDAIQSLEEGSETLADVTTTSEHHDVPDIAARVDSLTARRDRLRERAQTRRDVYQRVTATLDEVSETLDVAEETADDSASVDGFESVTDDLDRARELAEQHRLDDPVARVNSLRRRYERLSPERGRRTRVSETSSDESRLSLSYETIVKDEPLGSGGNADVYYATAATQDHQAEIALKEPRMAGTLHTDVVERMLEEAEMWQQLDDHDHIVSVVDYGSEPLPWIAMEYMDAGHLGERTDEFGFEQALWTAIATTKGVRHAHRQGVAHLDLKPENILFRSAEGWDVPKVADWGLSKHLLKHSKSVEGLSPHYAAPEQFDDEYGSTDDVTDIYQLGAVLYDLFTGHPPFEGPPARVMNRVLTEEPEPPSAVADIPQELDEILTTALSKEKSQRYESVLYLRDDLQDLRESL